MMFSAAPNGGAGAALGPGRTRRQATTLVSPIVLSQKR